MFVFLSATRNLLRILPTRCNIQLRMKSSVMPNLHYRFVRVSTETIYFQIPRRTRSVNEHLNYKINIITPSDTFYAS